MKNCTYKLNGVEFRTEEALNDYLLENFKEILKEVRNKELLVSFDKNNLDILTSELQTASENLKKVRASKLAEYKNIEDDIKYDDGAKSVLNWIGDIGLANPINREDYTRNILPIWKNQKPNLTEEQLNKELKSEFASWNYSQTLGRGMHYVAEMIFSGKKFIKPEDARKWLADSWKQGYNTNATLDGITDEALLYFIKSVNKLAKEIITPDVEKVFTEYIVEGNADPETKLRGKIDIVVVKKNGNIEIYDLKVSQHNLQDWDRDKLKFAKYQLEIYKRLLQSKGISYRQIRHFIIPVTINLDKTKLSEENDKLIIQDKTVSSITVENIEPISLTLEENQKLNEVFFTSKINELSRTTIKNEVIDDLVKMFDVENVNKSKFKNLDKQILKKKSKINSKGEFVFYDEINNTFKTFKTEKELDNYLDDYLVNIEDNLNKMIYDITLNLDELLIEVNSNPNIVKHNINLLNIKDNKKQEYINTLFSKYLYEKGWRVQYNDDLIDLGVIMLVNENSKKVDFISVIDVDPNIELKLKNGNNLLSNFYTDDVLETKEHSLKATKGNIELIKLINIANKILKDNPENFKINDLIVTNIFKQQSINPISLNSFISNYNSLQRSLNKPINKIQLEDPLIRFASFFNNIKQSLDGDKFRYRLSNLLKNKEANFAEILNLTPEERNLKLVQLQELLKEMQEKFFYREEGFIPDDSLESLLYTEIARTIVNLTGIETDPFNSVKLPTNVGNLFAGKLKLNRTFLNGIRWVPSDYIEMFKPIKEALNFTRYNIRNNYVTYKRKTHFYYNNFKGIKGNINLSELEYKKLFDTSENGRKYFLLKDPKTDKTLNAKQKEFLEWYLKDLNAIRFPNQTEEELRASGQWLMAGIMRAKTASNFISKDINLRRFISNLNSDIINQQDYVTEENSKHFETMNENELSQMYNIFSSTHNPKTRAEIIEKALKNNNVDDVFKIFELNLEVINDSVHLAYIREKEYNKILPSIQANIVMLKLASYITSDKEIEKTIDFINTHMKTTVFDGNLVSDESKQIMSVLNAAKKITTKSLLGYNTLSSLREFSSSFFNLYTKAISNTVFDSDRLNLTDVSKAFGYVWQDSIKNIAVLTKLEALNVFYGIANVSEDTLIARMNNFQGDPFKFNANMFWLNRSVDYIYRMTILTGYMMKHGCLDAYTLDKNKELKYDWKKDKRFDLYAKYKDSEHLLPEKLKDKFDFQRALYYDKLQEFVNQKFQIFDADGNSRNITMNDDLPHAYTAREIESIKQEVNTMFGYMDKDNTMEGLKRTLFILVGQFKSYLSAKKTQWLNKRGVYAEGKRVHAKTDNGELLYMHYDEDGNLIDINTEKSDRPYIKWEGKVTEGIFWSLVDLLNPKGLFMKDERLEMKKAWKDPVKRRNLLIAFNELMFWWLLKFLAELIFEDVKPKELTTTQRTFLAMVANARADLNILNVANNAFDLNPPSINFLRNVGEDVIDVFHGNLNPIRVATNNLGSLRSFKYDLNNWLPNPEREETSFVTDYI